jgi:hypothetical protein
MARRGSRLDDDPDEPEVRPELPDTDPTVGHGAVTDVSSSDQPAAVLWIPDCEQRRGWREYYVYRKEPDKRPMGFRSPERKPGAER